MFSSTTLSSKLRRLTTGALALLAAGAIGAVGGTFEVMTSAPQPAMASVPGGYISRSEVMARAADWYARNPVRCQYCSVANYTLDVDGAHGYRADCSGFVSMALHLSATPSPASFDLATSTWHTPGELDKHDLKPGDYLTWDNQNTADRKGHVILFEKWAPAYPYFSYYGFGGNEGEAGGLHHSTASLTPGGYIDSHPSGDYHAYRYKKIVDSKLDDFNNDGRVDILGRHATSKDLYLYTGNGVSGFSGSSVAGINWSGFDMITSMGDFTNDGKADVVARNATTKDLYLYPGNGSGGFGTSVYLGQNFAAYDMIVAPGDFNGDGNADLIARATSTQNLYLFLGNGSNYLSGSGGEIGQNWSAFDRIVSPGDFNGDGYSDLIARNATNKNLYLYPGNGTGGFLSSSLAGTNFYAFDLFIGAGDFDQDGKADLIARNATTKDLVLYPGNGTGSFTGAAVTIGTNFYAFDLLF